MQTSTASSGSGSGASSNVTDVAHHWFYRIRLASGKSQWKPFTMIDSVAIEEVFVMNPQGEDSALL